MGKEAPAGSSDGRQEQAGLPSRRTCRTRPWGAEMTSSGAPGPPFLCQNWERTRVVTPGQRRSVNGSDGPSDSGGEGKAVNQGMQERVCASCDPKGSFKGRDRHVSL